MYKEISGNLITLALEGKFDVIAHGCNCFCTMGAGIAPQMAKAFGCDDFPLERRTKEYCVDRENDEWDEVPTGYVGDINKLGQIDYKKLYIWNKHPSGNPYAMNHMTVGQEGVNDLTVVNAYTQYDIGRKSDGSPALDYEALQLCLRKMNHIFRGKRIGLPQIGCGLAGGDWDFVRIIIESELKDCDVTVVIFNK